MLLPGLVLLDGLNPDGDRGSPRARYRRVGGNQRQLGEERKKSKRVTMFWGPGWEFELYVAWRGGAKGSADTVRVDEGQQGKRGGMAGGARGHDAGSRAELLCIARPGLFQFKSAERTAARWVSPQKPGTSVRVDSAVGQMRMFRPRNRWADVQDCTGLQAQGRAGGTGRGSEWAGHYVMYQVCACTEGSSSWL